MALGSIPKRLKKAIPINPVSKNAIPKPRNGGGTCEYLIFSLIAASATMAKNHPKPPPKPKATDSPNVYSRDTINREPPKMAQFTVINGRNIPSELYSAGEVFSITISTNCTIDAMTAMNKINRKKVKSIPPSASSKRKVLINQLIGIVIPKTKITAKPNPNAVFSVFDTAKNEHIPKKYDKTKFSIKAALINIFTVSTVLLFKICQQVICYNFYATIS